MSSLQMCPLKVHSSCFLMVLALLLGKLRTHFGFCQIDRRLVLASEEHRFRIEINQYSCDGAEGGDSSALPALTIAGGVCLRQADVGSSADGAVGSGSMVDRPFLSTILSAADPEPGSSSFGGLSAKVKMVLPISPGMQVSNCLLGCLDLRPWMHQ